MKKWYNIIKIKSERAYGYTVGESEQTMNIEKIRNGIATKVTNKADFDALSEREKVDYCYYILTCVAVGYEKNKHMSAYLYNVAQDIRRVLDDYVANAYIALDALDGDADFFAMYRAVSNSALKWYRAEHGTPHEQKHRFVNDANTDYGAHMGELTLSETRIIIEQCLPDEPQKRALIRAKLSGYTFDECAIIAGVSRRTAIYTFNAFKERVAQALADCREDENVSIYWNYNVE